ncbi:MAG: glucose-6-phosphate isomerase [Parvibaculaceae bacterium]
MYECDISRSLQDTIGDGGLSQSVFEAKTALAVEAASRLKEAHGAGKLGFARLLAERADLEEMRAFADKLCENTSDLIILGIGGSSLGAQTLAQLGGWGQPGYRPAEGRPNVHMPENLDPVTFERLLGACDLRTTRFLVISKSGGTAEPLSQMLAAMTAIEMAGGGKYMKHHFGVVTGPGPGVLRTVAEEYGFPVLDHADVGGRFSVFSNTGLLPAMTVGLDAEKLRQGAAEALAATLEADRAAPVLCAAVTAGLLDERGIRQSALTAYDDRLQRFGLWFRQLWGESLGKNGLGLTPLAGLGPVDQHSQLQLYLAGPNDKLHTVITRKVAGEGTVAAPAFTGGALAHFAGKTIGDLVEAEQRATIETLARNGRPVRELRLPALDEANLGALLMHFMLETILVADLLGVDPYDQPAVEEGKILARAYLAGERPES